MEKQIVVALNLQFPNVIATLVVSYLNKESIFLVTHDPQSIYQLCHFWNGCLDVPVSLPSFSQYDVSFVQTDGSPESSTHRLLITQQTKLNPSPLAYWCPSFHDVPRTYEEMKTLRFPNERTPDFVFEHYTCPRFFWQSKQQALYVSSSCPDRLHRFSSVQLALRTSQLWNGVAPTRETIWKPSHLTACMVDSFVGVRMVEALYLGRFIMILARFHNSMDYATNLTLFVYDTETGISFDLRHRSLKMHYLDHPASTVFQGGLYLVGGCVERQYPKKFMQRKMYRIDLLKAVENHEFIYEERASLNHARYKHDIMVFNDKLLVMGGRSRATFQDSDADPLPFEEYNPETNQWSDLENTQLSSNFCLALISPYQENKK